MRIPKLAGFTVVVVAVLIAAGLSALASADSSTESSPETETLTLHPGDNFIGWVAEPLAVAELFEQIPEAELVYRWDAGSRRWQYAIRDGGGNFETLEPGMAAKIRISGSKTVDWERALTPTTGMVTLYAGENWVAWNGRDDWPLEQVARGIGTSLVSIEVRGQVYQPGSDVSGVVGPLMGEATIRRGDALRVTVNRDLRWLQPTGMMPNIVWVGDISQLLQDEISADIQHIVDYFAESFAVETDFADTTVLIWHGVEAAVRYAESGQQPAFPHTPRELRVRLSSDAGGGGTFWGAYVAACWWQPPCSIPRGEHERGRDLLAHEWFHYLQLQIANRVWTVSPEWMLEGTAIWGGDRGLGVADGTTTLAHDREWRVREASRTSATLRSAEERNAPWQYMLGTLAVDRLVERVNLDAPVEYFRQMHPQVDGPDRLWSRDPTWPEAFENAFGLTPRTFYEQFAAWQTELPRAGLRLSGETQLSGRLIASNDDLGTGFWINAASYAGEHKAGRIRRAEVGEDGAFSIGLETDAMQRIWFTRSGCTLWLTEDGLTASRPEPGQYRDLNIRNQARLELPMPGGACENEIQVQVTRLRNDHRPVELQLVNPDPWTWGSWATLNRYGAYSAYAQTPGPHLLMVRVGGCNLWWTEGGLVATHEAGELIEIGAEPVSLELRIPSDLCQRRISGRLTTEAGSPISGVWLTARSDGSTAGAHPDRNGHFTITVPENGDYWLGFLRDGCLLFFGQRAEANGGPQPDWITVADMDVSGIEFVVPADTSSACQ